MYDPDFESPCPDFSGSFWLDNDNVCRVSHVDKTILKGVKDPEIQYLIGFSYYVGAEYSKGRFDQDFSEAFYWIGKSAQQGHLKASYLYALMHYLGHGTDPSAERAIPWVEKAMEIGEDAWILRGLLAEDPVGSRKMRFWPRMREEAANWYTLAACKGSVDACVFLASLYRDYDPVSNPDNDTKIRKWYKLATENLLKCKEVTDVDKTMQAPMYQHFASRLYLQSQRAQKHYVEAFKYFDDIIHYKPGYANYQNFLGWLYLNGFGVTEDEEKAMEYFSRGAQQENAMSLYVIASNARNDDEKDDLYRKAANLGFAPAQYLMGYRLKWDEEEITERMKWYVLASDQGSLEAIYELAELFLESDAVKFGIKWLEKASSFDYLFANDRLARCFHYGIATVGQYHRKHKINVDIDLERAYSLYKKSDPIAAIHFPFNTCNVEDIDPEYKFHWWKIGANEGCAECQCELGIQYDKEGRTYEAYVMYRKAADQELGTDSDHNFYVKLAQKKLEEGKEHFAEAKKSYEKKVFKIPGVNDFVLFPLSIKSTKEPLGSCHIDTEIDFLSDGFGDKKI